MRVLLHNFETRLYYAGPDHWTEDALLAFDFGSIEQAVDLYKHGRLSFAEIVVDQRPWAGKALFSLPDHPKAAAA